MAIKALLIFLVIFTFENSRSEDNIPSTELNKTLHKGKSTYHITTNIYINGNDAILNFIKPIKHPNCPLNEDPAKPIHLSYPGNCGKFYICSAGYAYPMDCPTGLEWSIELVRCDYPEIAKCDPHAKTTLRTTNNPDPKPTTKPIETTTPEKEKAKRHPNCPTDEDPSKPTHLPYPGNCGKFYKCSAGYAFPMDCPSDLEWGIELNRCDYPEIAKCDPHATTTLRTTNNPDPEPTTEPIETTTPEKEKPKRHPNCPTDENPAKPTHLPYPGNCAKFYKCSAGYAFPMDCPTGLEWSIELDRCDYPEIAKCDPHATTTLRTTNNPDPEPTTEPIETTTPEKEKPKRHPNCPTDENPAKPTHLPYPGNCAKFYKCSAGYAFPMDCPTGLEWSIELDRCDYPEIAKCDPHATTTLRTTNNPDPEPTTEPIETTTPEKEKPKRHPNCPTDENPAKPTHLPYPGNCAKFFKCSAGYAVPMDCPTGLEWSIELDRCDYPEIAKCDPHATTTLRTTNNPDPEPTTEPIETTTPEKEKPKRHPNCPTDENPAKPTHLPYPGNCAKFYKCSAGYAFPMDCPTGLEWSIELNRCDYPEIAKCDPHATTTLRTTNNPDPEPTTEPIETTTPEKEKPKRHPNCPTDENPAKPTHLPYPGNCAKFYKCSAGYAYPMDCPTALEWSIELNRCDYPEIAKCDPHATTTLRTTNNPDPETTTESIETTTPEKEKPKRHPNCPTDENPAKPTHLPYPGNCAKFYKCSAGYAFPMDCPTGLEWSIELDRCDYPEIAKCDPHATTTLRTTNNPDPEPTTEPIETTTPEKEKPKRHPNCPTDENPAKPTHLPYPGNCAKFYKCSAGYAFPMDCPTGLEWSIELDRCDYPEIAKCDPHATTTLRTTNNPDPEPTTEPIETTTPEKEKPKRHPNCPTDENPAKPTHLPYPGNCAKFYKCSAGYAFPMDCPTGLEWSIELDRCDYPEIAKCDPRATTTLRTTHNSIPSTKPTKTTTPEKEKPKKHPNCPIGEDPAKPTHLPYPGNCGKFYKCSTGYAFPMDCQTGLEWSIELDRCDYPEIAKCDPRATTTLKPITRSTDVSTHHPDEDKPFRHPACPIFNYAEHEKEYLIYLPYPGKCNKYFKCSQGYAVPRYCPSGLHWSNKHARCEWPEKAGCIEEVRLLY